MPDDVMEMAPADWMSMTPADWMSMTPADWVNMTRSNWADPQRLSEWWQRSYGDLMSLRPADWLSTMYAQRPSTVTSPWQSRGDERREHRRPHGRGCRCHDCRCRERERDHEHGDCCRRCGSDPCACSCCIGDVDLAIYSRLGEQRVIPIVIENERRREKQVSLELSAWTTKGGKPAPVDTVMLEPKTFTIPACGEQKVTLVVKTREEGLTADNPNNTPGGRSPGERGKVPDVDDCLVATADLRVVGCDHRPIRIAVALLPRDCDPFTVPCGCSCC
jgi:hypothetical protein